MQLANDRINALIAPRRGEEHLYELDVRSICHNLLATITRRPEAYHRKVLGGGNNGNGSCASIHERVVFKQAGLDQRIQYDSYPRDLVDLFYDHGVTLEAVAAGQAAQRGDFVGGESSMKPSSRRNPDRIQVLMIRDGQAFGMPIRINKGLTLNAGSSTLEIAYLLEGLPRDRPLHFAVEFNFAGMPAGADDRYFYERHPGNNRASPSLQPARGPVGPERSSWRWDWSTKWLGIDVGVSASQPTGFWTFPVETVSQSEGGFELVHQSVAVQPHWLAVGDSQGQVVGDARAIDRHEPR